VAGGAFDDERRAGESNDGTDGIADKGAGLDEKARRKPPARPRRQTSALTAPGGAEKAIPSATADTTKATIGDRRHQLPCGFTAHM